MDFYFDDLPGLEECPWRPAADILRTAGGWVVKLDLAGVDPTEVRVELEGRVLKVSGARRDLHAAESVDHYRMEIAYSFFERHFELPCGDGPRIESTEYRDGMLRILLKEGA